MKQRILVALAIVWLALVCLDVTQRWSTLDSLPGRYLDRDDCALAGVQMDVTLEDGVLHLRIRDFSQSGTIRCLGTLCFSDDLIPMPSLIRVSRDGSAIYFDGGWFHKVGKWANE